MNYQTAKDLAERYASYIQPVCSRLEIVGSVKRGENTDHDIEFLVIADPKTPRPEFGQRVVHKNMLHKVMFDLCETGLLKFNKGGDKYRQYAILDIDAALKPFNLELWIVNERTWGIQNVIRTGPKEFSHRFVMQKSLGGLLPDDHRYIKGETRIEDRDGNTLSLPEESDALDVIGLGWIEPKHRHFFADAAKQRFFVAESATKGERW